MGAKAAAVRPRWLQLSIRSVRMPRRCASAASVMPSCEQCDMLSVWMPRKLTKAASVMNSCEHCDMLSVCRPRKCTKSASESQSWYRTFAARAAGKAARHEPTRLQMRVCASIHGARAAASRSAGGPPRFLFRGVASGGDGNHSGPLPSVGVYLDEQPITTIGGTLDLHIYDIARIESLSGPQGTLYGASSQAGTIRIITNKPDSSSSYGKANFELNTVAHGEIGGKAEFFYNAALSSNAALRVVGFYQRDGGYIDNVSGSRRCGCPPT